MEEFFIAGFADRRGPDLEKRGKISGKQEQTVSGPEIIGEKQMAA